MRRRILPLLGFILLPIAACAPPDTASDTPPAAVDIAADEQAVRDMSMQWLEFQNARNAAGIAALFTDDGVLFRDNEEPVVGRAAIESDIASDWAENPEVMYTWSTDRVVVSASGDLAVEYGTWSQTAGGTDRGRYVTTYRKIDGTWRIISDMSLSTVAEGGAFPSAP